MYLQITTTCNMKCRHCAFSATRNGIYMSNLVISQAIMFARRYNIRELTIGGGEPTTYRSFPEIIKAVAPSFDGVTMITNGKNSEILWKFLFWVDSNESNIVVELSLDEYHEPINPQIVEFFEKRSAENDPHFKIRNVGSDIILQGRATKNFTSGIDHCICDELLINPLGKIYVCGCEDAPQIGHVSSGIDQQWYPYLSSKDYKETYCWNKKGRHHIPANYNQMR